MSPSEQIWIIYKFVIRLLNIRWLIEIKNGNTPMFTQFSTINKNNNN